MIVAPAFIISGVISISGSGASGEASAFAGLSGSVLAMVPCSFKYIFMT
jgi:hypothetical protein